MNKIRLLSMFIIVSLLLSCVGLAEAALGSDDTDGFGAEPRLPVAAEPVDDDPALALDAFFGEIGEEQSGLIAAEPYDAQPSMEAGGIAIDSTAFADAAFREYVKNAYDINGDGFLSQAEADNVTAIYLTTDDGSGQSHGAIKANSLAGIEHFKNLAQLVCFGCGLKSLDVSKNADLEMLVCYDNDLTSLKLGSKSRLSYLKCENATLQSVDISGCPLLLQAVERGTFTDAQVCSYSLNSVYLSYNRNTRLEGAASAAPSTDTPPETDPAPGVAGTPAISAAAKSTKVSVTAVPGTVYQLDLGGATGKKFKSSKKKVATVNAAGLVTVKGAGKTKITFKVGKKKRTVTLKVIDPTVPTAIALNQSGTVAVRKGDTVALTATLNEGAVSGIKWKSSNKKVATVKDGVVTFKKKGKVTITATTTRGKKKAKVKFKVSK